MKIRPLQFNSLIMTQFTATKSTFMGGHRLIWGGSQIKVNSRNICVMSVQQGQNFYQRGQHVGFYPRPTDKESRYNHKYARYGIPYARRYGNGIRPLFRANAAGRLAAKAYRRSVRQAAVQNWWKPQKGAVMAPAPSGWRRRRYN